MNSTDFFADNTASNRYQDIVVDWLESKGYTVMDVSMDKEYQLQDIDFIVTKGTVCRTVEFKADNWMSKTGNIAFEVMSNLELAKPGCLTYSKADWLYYYDTNSHVLHAMKLVNLREMFSNGQLNTGTWKSTHTKAGQGSYTTINLLIRLDNIKKALSAKGDYRHHDLNEYATKKAAQHPAKELAQPS